jgi:hypothetical protein
MSQKIATDERVAEAMAKLREKNVNPTIDNIREYLGGGSPDTVSQAMKRVEARTAASKGSPQALVHFNIMYDCLVGTGRAERQPEVDELLAKIATLTTERDAARTRERDLAVERNALKEKNGQLNAELTAALKDCAIKSAKLETVMEELGAAKERAHRLELAVAGANSQSSKSGDSQA